MSFEKKKIKICIVFGTRPEAIKLAPVIKAIEAHPAMESLVISTGQHQEMLDQMVEIFQIRIDHHLKLMSPNQSLSGLTSKILSALPPIYIGEKPDAVITQGDTTTAFTASLSAYYHQIKIGHVEAGLRTYQKYSPFPEEINRKLIASLCDWSFAPTDESFENLIRENVPQDSIHQVGNTVVDALHDILGRTITPHPVVIKTLTSGKKLILMTFHRREKFGEGFENVCKALQTIAKDHTDVNILYPVHLNPKVQTTAKEMLKNYENIHLIPPMSYIELVHTMKYSHFVLTDSGGIQEEAPVLGKPVLVMRDFTERPEGIRAGVAILVGTETDLIVREAKKLLNDETHYRRMSKAKSLYGDGNAALRIVDIIAKSYGIDSVPEQAAKIA